MYYLKKIFINHCKYYKRYKCLCNIHNKIKIFTLYKYKFCFKIFHFIMKEKKYIIYKKKIIYLILKIYIKLY